MGQNTAIEWTDHTFNPWRGCTKVSAGCANCYAETLSGRNPKTLGVWGPNGTRVVASEERWKEPLKWDRQAQQNFDEWAEHSHAGSPPPARPRVFCASLADVFEDWTGPMATAQGHPLAKCRACLTVGHSSGGFPGQCKCGGGMLEIATMQDVRTRLFSLIDSTPNLDWLLLTKRPENVLRMMPDYERTTPSRNVFLDPEDCKRRGVEPGKVYESTMTVSGVGVFRPNLWLGTSVENQQAADERIPRLLKVPAKVRFLSIEPCLGPIDLTALRTSGTADDGVEANALTGVYRQYCSEGVDHPAAEQTFEGGPKVGWVIVGGESGHGARPMHPAWARSLRDQCQAAGVPFFFKQWGEYDYTPVEVKDRSHVCAIDLLGRDWALSMRDGRVSHLGPGAGVWTLDTPSLPVNGLIEWNRVGKKAAGRLLDGRTWDEFPDTTTVPT